MALLPTDPTKQKRLLLAVVPLLALFMYHQLMHGKSVEAADLLQGQLEQLTATNNAARALAARGGPELEKRLAIYEEHMRELEELIPRREEVSELIHSVTLRAQSSGVDLTKVRPEATDPGAFYTKQIYEMAVRGTYHDVGVFLTEIGSLPRIITPTEVKITKAPATDRRGNPLLDVSFRVVTYVIPEPPVVAADNEGANVTG